ncbi:MAG: iron ABC transporter permease [Anaerolineaceae bacterium]|nr:MAG: iron ABC transporter permease [Anaerolineaceae bacterium]
MSAISRPQPHETTTNARRVAPNIRRKGVFLAASLSALLLVVSLLSIGSGQLPIRVDQVVTILADEVGIQPDISFNVGESFSYPAEYSTVQRGTLINIRLPRVVLGLLIGASLAAAGATIQGMFRNPLADPGLIGISAGSAFAAALVIVLGNTAALSPLAGSLDEIGVPLRPIASFIGGVVTTLLIYRLATVNGRTSVPTMLLAGIALNALAGAGVGMLVAFADDSEIRDITFWQLGSLVDGSWERVETVVPFILISLVPMLWLSRPLNALLFGEIEAEHLGFNIQRTKQFIIVLAAVAVGTGVAVAGIVGFVGLVVPHLIRLLAGPDHRYVIPGSMLLGAALLVGADLIARTIAEGREIPLGVVTALIGAPFFLYLLLKDRERGTLI